MRFSVLAAGAFALLVSADSSSEVPTSTAAADPAQQSIINCLDACTPGDVNCTSHCIAVPNPSANDVEKTNQCIAACPQGSGTAADSLNYKNCETNCIAEYYYTATGTPAEATGAAGSGSGATGTASGSATGTASSSTSTASSTKNAAVGVTGSSAAGLVGFLAAFLAL